MHLLITLADGKTEKILVSEGLSLNEALVNFLHGDEVWIKVGENDFVRKDSITRVQAVLVD